MAGVELVIGLGLIIFAAVIAGHLGRIADAVEAQNRHYQIDESATTTPNEEAV